MVAAVRRNFGVKLLSLALAILGWAYFRFATNPLIAARFDQQISVPAAAINVPPGYVAQLPQKTITVTVTPRRGEGAIKPEELRAVVDVANRGAGVYNLPVQLVAPNIAVQSRTPASMAVTVARMDRQTFPVAAHYSGTPGGVVNGLSITPAAVGVDGPANQLSEVAAVRVDLTLAGPQEKIDQMLPAVPVSASGEEVAGVQVTPNLVRVRAQLVPAAGAHR